MKLGIKGKLNNKGAGFITVMVAIIFLTALGSVLLMLSYTGLEMRTSDRTGKENLYDASGVMEQMNLAVQDVCSDAIVSAYDEVFPYYNYFGVDITKEFQKTFGNYVEDSYYSSAKDKWLESTGSGTADLRLIDSSTHTYNVNILTSWLTAEGILPAANEDGSYTIMNGSDVYATVLIYPTDDNGNRIESGKGETKNFGLWSDTQGEYPDYDMTEKPMTLKNVTVEYTRKNHTTKITTDISINYPNVGYSNKIYSETGINEHACIINGTLTQRGETCRIYGSGYFGAVDTTAPGGSLIFDRLDTEDSRFVVAGDVDITGNGWGSEERFNVGENSELWTENININTSGSAELLGTTYVANDLLLGGTGASAKLGGAYYGFGTSSAAYPSTVETTDADGNVISSKQVVDSSKSSSIIVNAKNTSLDMTDLESLTLAGYAFVGDSNYYQTSQSVAVMEDQLDYLIPNDLIVYDYSYTDESGKTVSGTNTPVLSNPEVMTLTKYQGVTNWSLTDGSFSWNSSKKPSDYGISIRPVVERTDQQVKVYLFMNFDSETHRNAFFKDYFRYNGTAINKYLANYVTINGMADGASTETMGSTYTSADGKNVSLKDYITSAEAQSLYADATTYADKYEELKTNLSQGNIQTATGSNPLANILSSDLDSISGYVPYYDDQGIVVAIATSKDVEIVMQNGTAIIKIDGQRVSTANPDNVSLIVTSGDITVSGVSYDGLLMGKGDLTLTDGAVLNRNPQNVVSAYSAKSSNGGTISDYIDDGNDDAERDSNAWAVTDLVSYDNWNRTNED